LISLSKKTKILIGLVWIILSYILGWPAVGAVAGISAYLKAPMIGLIGCPAIYIFSWLMLFAGVFMIGKDSYRLIKEGGIRNFWKNMMKEESN